MNTLPARSAQTAAGDHVAAGTVVTLAQFVTVLPPVAGFTRLQAPQTHEARRTGTRSSHRVALCAILTVTEPLDLLQEPNERRVV